MNLKGTVFILSFLFVVGLSGTAAAQSCLDYSASDCPREECQLIKSCGGEVICYDPVDRQVPECGGTAYVGAAECCEGLVRKCGIEFFSGDCRLTVEGSAYNAPLCLPCGNGICNQFENRCNCPEDCGEGLNKVEWEWDPETATVFDEYKSEGPVNTPATKQTSVTQKQQKRETIDPPRGTPESLFEIEPGKNPLDLKLLDFDEKKAAETMTPQEIEARKRLRQQFLELMKQPSR